MTLRSTPPAVHQLGHLDMPGIDTVTLDRGTLLHTLDMGHEPVARLTVICEGGALDAPHPSLPAITSALSTEGTLKADGATIAEAFASRGATIRPIATSHCSGFEVAALTSGFDHVVGLLSDIILEPSFPEKELGVMLRRNAQAARVAADKIEWQADTMRDALIAGADHPQARRATPDDILAISRDDIIRWRRSVIDSARCHTYLCGHYDSPALTAVTQMLDHIAVTADICTGPSPRHIVPYSHAKAGRHITDRPASLQSAISIALPAPARTSPHYIPLRLAVMALGGYFGSRLMANLREDKGYTYGASAALYGTAEGCFTGIDVRCDNSHTDAVINETAAELRRLATEPPRGDELARLLRHATSVLASTLDTPFSIMDYHISRLVADIPAGYFEMQQSVLASLTPDTIAEMASLYLDPEAMRIAIVGAEAKMSKPSA